jgi:methionyl-tRNA synthetase
MKYTAILPTNLLNRLYSNGYLKKMTNLQFYDSKYRTFLKRASGCRQMPRLFREGLCHECSNGISISVHVNGHPQHNIGDRPEMCDAVNWYFRLDDFGTT